MEWEKAKKYIIILLVAVNILLFGINLYRANDTVVSSSRMNNVISVLKDRDVTVNCTLPNKHRPMAKLGTAAFTYDYIKLQNLFMPDKSDVKRTDRYNSVVITSDNSSLVIKGSSIEYVGTLDKAVSSSDAAVKYGNSVADSINSLFGNFVFHSAVPIDDGYMLKYYCKYENINIFSNFLYVTIKENSVNIALNYSAAEDNRGERADIIGSDEAVFAAIDSIKEDFSDKCGISSVELGYYDSLISSSDENYAVPCYVVRVGTKEYFINAYTAEVM